MARPKNTIVTRNGVVYSVTPKNLKTFLERSVTHTDTPLVGKVLGRVAGDLTVMSADRAAQMLATVFPTVTVATVPDMDPANADHTTTF